jgi:hypothetical protein
VPSIDVRRLQLRHGTLVERDRGLPVRAVERHGVEVWRAAWDDARLVRLVVTRPDRGALILEADGGVHPLLGAVHAIVVDGSPVASCGAIDWVAPRFVPPIDRPGSIPAGGGSAILNFLARRAEVPLRYRGPYPTAALFDALLHSFAVDDPAAALLRFNADVDAVALAGEMREVDVDFTAAPHEWIWPAPGVCVELRDGVERVFVDGRAYARGHHRDLVRDGDGWAATIAIAGSPWFVALRVAADGSVVDGPHPVPRVDSSLIGVALPDEIAALLAEVIAARDGGPFAPAIASALRSRPLVFADTGDALADAAQGQVRVHAVLGERLGDADPVRMLALLVDAIEPVVRRLAQQDLACALPGEA